MGSFAKIVNGIWQLTATAFGILDVRQVSEYASNKEKTLENLCCVTTTKKTVTSNIQCVIKFNEFHVTSFLIAKLDLLKAFTKNNFMNIMQLKNMNI